MKAKGARNFSGRVYVIGCGSIERAYIKAHNVHNVNCSGITNQLLPLILPCTSEVLRGHHATVMNGLRCHRHVRLTRVRLRQRCV